ncbi:MAG: glycosyltransferase family 39 protein, partial [Firmicutes bacterium]|nr:glycosyltransferase family 39 protein [Bacillota bacterium]
GFTDEASALSSGLFFILTSPVVFLLARQWFGNLVAAGSVLVYTLTPKLLYFSISGMTEPLAVFLMTAAVLSFSSRSLKNSTGDWLSGIILGLFSSSYPR